MPHGHIEHPAGFRIDRQERRIGRLPFFAKGREHDVHDRVVALGNAQQHRVEPTGFVIIGRGGEFVVEAECIKEPAQHGIVVVAERGIVTAERVWHHGQRLVQMRLERSPVRHIVRNLAHAIQVVGKAQQLGLHAVLGQDMKGVPNHCRACDFAERADMRQAGRPVAGFKQHLLGKAGLFIPFDDLARFLEWPGLAFDCRFDSFGGNRGGIGGSGGHRVLR